VLKSHLSKDKLLALKSKLLLAKGSEMKTMSHVRHFLGLVMAILQEVEPRIKLKALLSFACMLPGELSDEYSRLVADSVEASSSAPQKAKSIGLGGTLSRLQSNHIAVPSSEARRDQPAVPDVKRKVEDAEYIPSQSQSTYMTGPSEVKTEGSGQIRSYASKRAKLLLSASLSAPAAPVVGSLVKAESGVRALCTEPRSAQIAAPTQTKPSFLSKLSSLNNIALTGAVKASNLAGSRTSRPGNFSCTVCKEVATDPCAARCGHVCCQVCWTRWLKVNSSCPLCRKHADVNSVTRIIVKE
jgi:hypothetical protein